MNEKPPIKSYCGGKPNYCTPLQSDRIRIDPVTGDVSIGTPVDAVNMNQERVDEKAKGEHDELRQCVYELFTKYLNLVEESESGRMFNPITIGCCRVMLLEPLDKLLDRMRKLSGSEPNPLYNERNT